MKTKSSVTLLTMAMVMGMSVPTMAKLNTEGVDAGVGKDWDQHVLVPYVDVEDRGIYDLKHMVVDTAITRYNLGFMVANKSGELVWLEDRLTKDYRNLDRDVAVVLKELREMDADGKVCFGGPLGTPLYTVEKSRTELVKAYEEVIDTYNLTAVDFYMPGTDLSKSDVTAIKRNIDAIRSVSQKYPDLEIWLTFETDYKGMDEGVKACITYAEQKGIKAEGINFAITQYKNPLTKDLKPMGAYTVGILENTYSEMKALFPKADEEVLWDKMGVTVTIGENAFDELFKVEDAEEVASYAATKGMGYVGYLLAGEDTKDYGYGEAFATYLVDKEDEEATKPAIGVYKGHWHAGANYEVGDVVKFQNNYYICRQGHQSLGGWQPSKVAALWNLIPGDLEDLEDRFENGDDVDVDDILSANGKKWDVGVQYKVGDFVFYKGKWYTCVQSHSADAANWTPDHTPALWEIFEGEVNKGKDNK